MSTALDLIKYAGKLIGVYAPGETPSNDDANDCLIALNYLIDSWNNQSLALYNTTNHVATLTGGKNPHTLGVGGDINIARPLKITRAFTRVVGVTYPVDFIMEQIDNDRYQEISVKKYNTTYPTHFYYDSSYPLANFYTYPIQSTSLELHLSVWSKLSHVTLNTTITLPDGYEYALCYNLALAIAPLFEKSFQRGSWIFDEAARLLMQIKAINQQANHMIIDTSLVGGRGKQFNILQGF